MFLLFARVAWPVLILGCLMSQSGLSPLTLLESLDILPLGAGLAAVVSDQLETFLLAFLAVGAFSLTQIVPLLPILAKRQGEIRLRQLQLRKVLLLDQRRAKEARIRR